LKKAFKELQSQIQTATERARRELETQKKGSTSPINPEKRTRVPEVLEGV